MDRIASSSSTSAATATACGAWGRCEGLAGRLVRRWRKAAVIGVLVVGACGSPYYTSDPIEAWVVDAETGKPIEAAIVVANWQLLGFTLDTGGSRNHQLAVMETVTDKTGRFFFPGFTRVNFRLEKLGEEDPRVLIFKPGYLVTTGQSSYPANGPDPSLHRKSRVNGRQFKLEPAAAEAQTYVQRFALVSDMLMDLSVGGSLGEAPRLLSAAVCEKRQLIAIHGKRFLFSVPGEGLVDPQCAHS